MSDTIIKVENLSKRYRIGLQEKKADTFSQQMVNALKYPIKNFQQIRNLGKFKDEEEGVHWALKDVSFEVKQGEVLGIIGKNGAGKSTLLKILSRITEPTSGKVEINGRIAALLEVGTGFHPELTGRENIYMNGTILGMTKREINRKLDEIIEFSGVEKFVDTPIKFYSSGMKVRLGFSVAAHLDPEILVIDEVLAVGDYEFQQKCLVKMEGVSQKEGRTVLFVSHNLLAVKNLCQKILLLNQGEKISHTIVNEGLNNYLSLNSKKENLEFKLERSGLKLNFFLNNYLPIKSGDKFTLSVNLLSSLNLENISIAIGINTIFGERLYTYQSYIQLGRYLHIKKNIPLNIRINESRLTLVSGLYKIILTIYNNQFPYLECGEILTFNVNEGDFYNTGKIIDSSFQGNILVNPIWEIK